MTERARIREEYKAKKRLPAPEVPKHFGKRKGDFNFIIEYKINPENKQSGWSEFVRRMWKSEANEWRTHNKYRDGISASKALDNLARKTSFYIYRLREIKKDGEVDAK